MTGVVVWTKQEDELLLAIAHEFSGNWTLVSEVLSLSLSMQGIYRPPAMCKQRFRQITVRGLREALCGHGAMLRPAVQSTYLLGSYLLGKLQHSTEASTCGKAAQYAE